MFNIDSIANKFRLSYFVFAILLCVTFVSIFMYAETRMEQELVKGRLLQQLVLSQEKEGDQPIYIADPGIKIYRLANAPDNLKELATDTVQEIRVKVNGKEGVNETNLHFFAYEQYQQDQLYLKKRPEPNDHSRFILTYLEDSKRVAGTNPVLAIFEDLEDIFSDALKAAVLLSLLIAAIFSHLSSKQITKPLLNLKQAVEANHQNLNELTHLPSEVGVLARAIDDKNHELAQYLKREQLFTGDVSHELRTPLTIILGASEVLASQLADDSYLSEFTTRISNTAQETSEIISALLMLSRNPEHLDNPATSINTIANSEVARLQYLLKHKSVSCEVIAERDYSAHVRPELLKMALGNLIKNAFQYTDAGEVTVTIDAQKITVIDTGIGISQDMMPLLYERFERLGNNLNNAEQNPSMDKLATIQVDGSGLGLSIVHRIITHLDWQLIHQANQSGGSTFIIYYS